MAKLRSAIAATLLLGAGIASVGPASAASGIPNALQPAIDQLDADAIVQAQYSWRGRRYCFYPDGWRRPGWYRCGYHLRRGFGWGGPMGWHGWDSGPRRGFHHGGREYRRGEGRQFRSGEGREFRGSTGGGMRRGESG